MRYLTDTNIVLRSVQPGHPMHADAIGAVTSLLTSGIELCIFNQSLIEFWNVATRSVEINGLGLTLAQTDNEVRRIETMLTVSPTIIYHPTSAIFSLPPEN